MNFGLVTKTGDLLENPIPKFRQDEDPGAWRIEIEPIERSKATTFLNVLYPHMSDTESVISISIEKADVLSKNISGTLIKTKKQNWSRAFYKPDK